MFGPDHAVTLSAATCLALALAQLGEAEPARALGEDTLQRSRQVFGPDHPITLYLAQAVGNDHLMQSGEAAPDGPSPPL